MENELSIDGTHRLMLKNGTDWIVGYIYRGSIWKISNPKVNRIIQNQHGYRYKVVNIGTEWDKLGDIFVPAVYAIPWD